MMPTPERILPASKNGVLVALAVILVVGVCLVVVAALSSSAPTLRQKYPDFSSERLLRTQISQLEDRLGAATHLELAVRNREMSPGDGGFPAALPSEGDLRTGPEGTGNVPRFLLIAGLSSAGQQQFVSSLLKTVPGRLYCDARLAQLLLDASTAQGEDGIAAHQAFETYAAQLLVAQSKKHLFVLNGCAGDSGQLFPVSVEAKPRKSGMLSLDHADPPQLEQMLRRMGSDLAVVYVQNDGALLAALQADPGTARTLADNLRILTFFLLQLRTPVGCISMSTPTAADAESVLQALSLFPADELAPQLLANIDATAPAHDRIAPSDDYYPAWAHSSLPFTVRQISAICANLSLPSFPIA